MIDHPFRAHETWTSRDQCEHPLHDPNDASIYGICGARRSEHMDEAHALKVQLATALREHERTKDALGDAFKELREVQSALAAARRECEGLTSSVMHLRLVGTQMATFIEEQMPLFGGASSEFDGEGEPREILKRWRKADKIADKSYGPALAAPAAATGEEGK